MTTQDKTTKATQAIRLARPSSNGSLKVLPKAGPGIRFDNPGVSDAMKGFVEAGTATAALPRAGLIVRHDGYECMGVINEVRELFSVVVDEDGQVVPWTHCDLLTPIAGSPLDLACRSGADYKTAIDPAHLFAMRIRAEIAVFMAQARRDFPKEQAALTKWEKDMEDAFAEMDSDALVSLSAWYIDRHVVRSLQETAVRETAA
jgi:hypothetical protein